MRGRRPLVQPLDPVLCIATPNPYLMPPCFAGWGAVGGDGYHGTRGSQESPKLCFVVLLSRWLLASVIEENHLKILEHGIFDFGAGSWRL